MSAPLYKPDEVVVITKGKHTGEKAKVVMSWDNKNFVLEVVNKDRDMTLKATDEFTLEEADNATYVERMLPSINDYM